MKELRLFFTLAITAILLTATSCTKEDPLVNPASPMIDVTVDIQASEYLPGTKLVFTVSASAGDENGILDKLTITPSVTGEACPVFGSYDYNTSEDVTYTYVVPFESGSININFELTAVNPGDLSLTSSATYDYVFDVTNSFTEYKNVKLYSLAGDESLKSLIRMDNGETYSFTESYDGSDDLKLGIDFFAGIKNDTVGGETVQTAGIYSTAAVLSGATHIMLRWGDGDWKPHRRHTVAPNGIGIYNIIDYDAIVPEDVFVVKGSAVSEVAIGDVITFEPGTVGGFNPDGDALIRTNTPIMGVIVIKDINYGTLANKGGDGYIVFDYKFIDK